MLTHPSSARPPGPVGTSSHLQARFPRLWSGDSNAPGCRAGRRDCDITYDMPHPECTCGHRPHHQNTVPGTYADHTGARGRRGHWATSLSTSQRRRSRVRGIRLTGSSYGVNATQGAGLAEHRGRQEAAASSSVLQEPGWAEGPGTGGRSASHEKRTERQLRQKGERPAGRTRGRTRAPRATPGDGRGTGRRGRTG